MAIRGIEDVTSEIGALSRYKKDKFKVNRETLIKSLCRSFNATRGEAEHAINSTLRSGVTKETDNEICLIIEDPDKLLPCPFCEYEEVCMNVFCDPKGQMGYVCCPRCEAQGPLKMFDEIVKSWNRRVV